MTNKVTILKHQRDTALKEYQRLAREYKLELNKNNYYYVTLHGRKSDVRMEHFPTSYFSKSFLVSMDMYLTWGCTMYFFDKTRKKLLYSFDSEQYEKMDGMSVKECALMIQKELRRAIYGRKH